jgi:predicted Rossmann fold flavoprotein
LLIKNYPRGEKEMRNVFSKFTVKDTIDWFASRGVKLKIEADGRMFPESNSSETIINCLMQETIRLGILIKLQVNITKIAQLPTNDFELTTVENEKFVCTKLIIATGGNSKAEAYNYLEELGHRIIAPIPSLFTFNIPNNLITELMGVSVSEAKVKIAGTKLETLGPLLITHWGLSGPSVLKLSAFGAKILFDLKYNFDVFVNWCTMYNEEKLLIELENQKIEIAPRFIYNNNPFELPKRLWEYLLQKADIASNTRWADLSKRQGNSLVNVLLRDCYKIQGKTTFKEEFVTCGGISLNEINLTRMESKVIKNLFFAGEVINVDGITGGFNFQNAWSTAAIAAKAVGVEELKMEII